MTTSRNCAATAKSPDPSNPTVVTPPTTIETETDGFASWVSYFGAVFLFCFITGYICAKCSVRRRRLEQERINREKAELERRKNYDLMPLGIFFTEVAANEVFTHLDPLYKVVTTQKSQIAPEKS